MSRLTSRLAAAWWVTRHGHRVLAAWWRRALKAWHHHCCRQLGHDWRERPMCKRCGAWSPELLAAANDLALRRDPVQRVISQNYARTCARAWAMQRCEPLPVSRVRAERLRGAR